MLAGISSEALARISTARALLRIVKEREAPVAEGVPASGDDASRSLKGLLFIHMYGVYEYVVCECVRALIVSVNSRGLQCQAARTELLSMALHPGFSSIIDGGLQKTWASRTRLLKDARSSAPVEIHEGLFPKDGSHFRPDQLELVWEIFGMPRPVVPEPKHLGHITLLVEERNRIAHGKESPDSVGRRYDAAELEKRVGFTEAVCSHILACARRHTGDPKAFNAA